MKQETEILIGDAVDMCPLFLTVRDVEDVLTDSNECIPNRIKISTYLKEHYYHLGRGLYYLLGKEAFICNMKQYAWKGRLTREIRI